MSSFGQYLRLKRIEGGLSQRELARAAGLSVGAISMIERGERTELRTDTARRLALALDLDPGEVMNKIAPQAPQSSHPAAVPA